MPDSKDIRREFDDSVVSDVYNIVDLATRSPVEQSQATDSLRNERTRLLMRVDKLNAWLQQENTEAPTPPATLSPRAQSKSANLQRCLIMCNRMTSSVIDAEGRLLCGGIHLKSVTTANVLQANWDLIDAITGADA